MAYFSETKYACLVVYRIKEQVPRQQHGSKASLSFQEIMTDRPIKVTLPIIKKKELAKEIMVYHQYKEQQFFFILEMYQQCIYYWSDCTNLLLVYCKCTVVECTLYAWNKDFISKSQNQYLLCTYKDFRYYAGSILHQNRSHKIISINSKVLQMRRGPFCRLERLLENLSLLLEGFLFYPFFKWN